MPEEEIEDNMPDFEEVFKMIGEVKQDLRDEMAIKKDHNDLKQIVTELEGDYNDMRDDYDKEKRKIKVM